MTDSRQQAPSRTGSPARQQPAGETAPQAAARGKNVPGNAAPENKAPEKAADTAPAENAAASSGHNEGAAPAAQPRPDQGTEPAAPRRRRGHRRVSTGGAAASPGAAFNLKAAEDEPAAWGDKGEDRESWLKAQRPPHWG